jgi:hypothetical protein
MTTYNLSAFAGAGAQFFDDNGSPLVGGKLYSYAAGTSTLLATYTTSAGTVANTNPIILNAGGRTPNEIWQATGILLKFVLYNSDNELIGTYDGIPSINDPFGINSQLSSVAGTNSITATATPTLTAYATGAIYSFIAVNTNSGAATLSIDGLTATSITKNGSVALSAGDIQSGKMMLVEYDGTTFQLVNNIVYGGSITNGNIVSLTSPLGVSNGGTGASTLTSNNVILGNGVAAVQFVAPGSSGNVLASNGTTWSSTTIQTGFSNVQVFTSSGTFTVPAGITRAKVTVVGGGGSGAAGAGGGGGGGGTAIEIVTGLTPAGTVTVTVGGVAGTSSFGSYCSATGGATVASITGGAGGVGSGGDINLSGSGGGGGGTGSGFSVYGTGGSSSFGGGGYGNINAAGGNGGNYGGGGAGGGGVGAGGVVIVEY